MQSKDLQVAIAELPPPWEASTHEIAQATARAGVPLIYQLGVGWVPLDTKAAKLLRAFQVVTPPPPSKPTKPGTRTVRPKAKTMKRPRFTKAGNPPVYRNERAVDPTPEEIQDVCKLIQAEWSDQVRRNRCVAATEAYTVPQVKRPFFAA